MNAAVCFTNAKNQGFATGTFDIALCGFMAWDDCFDFDSMQFTQPDKKAKEIWRVLRAGGRFMGCSWKRQEDLRWMEAAILRHYPAIQEDREYLSRNHAHKTRAELAKHFGVSVDSVAHQLWRMGLTKIDRWDEKRDQYLRDNHLFLTNKQLARRLKTTPLAINNRLIRLGLRRYFRWTPEAEKYLRDNLLRKSDREMADALLTTTDSVSKKLRRMKLKRPPRTRKTEQ